MKTTLLFLTALAAIPAYAGNINFDDWALDTNWGGDYAVDEDGTLSLENVALTYTPETFKMQDGTSLSITLTFDPSSVTNTTTFAFSPYATGIGGNDTLIALTGITGIYGRPYITSSTITPGGASTIFDIPLNLSQAPNESTLVLNFYVENDDLHFTYALNGIESQIWIWDAVAELNWKPFLAVQGTSVNVTEMTLTPEPSPSVPEPSTATLSLLALAGLAARRRRK